MKQNHVLYPLVLLFFFLSCTQETPTEESPAPVETDIEKLDNTAIRLSCVEVTQPGDQTPHNDVYINISGNEVRVGEVLICNTIDSTEYDRYGIPTEAICAVGGEVSDDGMVVYAMRQREKYIVVRQGLRRVTENGVEYQHRALVNFSPENLSSNPSRNKAELVGTYTYQGIDHSLVLFATVSYQDLNLILFEMNGELPPTDQLMQAITQHQPTPVTGLNINMQDLSFTSSIGPGKFEKGEEQSMTLTLTDRLDPTGRPIVLKRVLTAE